MEFFIDCVIQKSRSSGGNNLRSICPTGLVPVDKGLATKTTRTQEVAPHPDLASVEARFENYVRSCVRDTGNRSANSSNLASTGMKPVGDGITVGRFVW